MELKARVAEAIQGGQKFDRHNIYLALYHAITGEVYPNKKCTGCANRYLFHYLKGWHDKN